jgi:hypothetical protein
VIEALELLKRFAATRVRYLPNEEDPPIGGVVRSLWKDAVLAEDARGEVRVLRIVYEICVLEALREKLRCKEVWVEGADRYRNPEEDLPQDFEQERESYYAALELPTDADVLVDGMQQEMTLALQALDSTMARNPHVRIRPNG